MYTVLQVINIKSYYTKYRKKEKKVMQFHSIIKCTITNAQESSEV